jgi:uncharacterized protein
MKYLTALALIALATSAQAVSFDCNKATEPTEALICQNDALSVLDSQNAAIFYRLREVVPFQHRASFNARERAWISSRNACSLNYYCVMYSYTQHISDLCTMAENFGMGLAECEEPTEGEGE